MPLRLVFMGTPEFAVPTLAAVIGAGHDIAAVYTQPPRPAGRGMAERKSPVHTLAESAGLKVLTPASLKSPESQQTFAGQAADVAVIVAYGLLLPRPILVAPREGCLNLHPSKLPRWRGAAPLQRTIMAGDSETAVMVMRMDEGLDTGSVCMAEPYAIGPELTAGGLHDALSRLGADLMLRALGALERGSLDCQPQSVEGVTYATKIDKAETRIDWSRPAREVHDHIRGLSPFPGAWLETGPEGGAKERLKVLKAQVCDGSGPPGTVLDEALAVACGSGAVRLLTLQRQGKRPMPAGELLRGFSLPRGARLA